MISTPVIWIYVLLLIAGGLVGFCKAKSAISLYTALGFAALLSLCAADVIPVVAADWLMAALMLGFGLRLAQTRKFMPSGLMLVITILFMALAHLLAR